MTPNADDIARAADALNHRAHCDQPDTGTFLGRKDGNIMLGCHTCHAAAPVHLLLEGNPKAAVETAPQFSLECVRCGTTIRLHRPTPRIPVCRGCTHSKGKPPRQLGEVVLL